MNLPLLELWYLALRAELGIKVQSDNPENLRPRLYAARAEAGDPQLEELSIFMPPEPAGELWIMRRTINDEENSNG